MAKHPFLLTLDSIEIASTVLKKISYIDDVINE